MQLLEAYDIMDDRNYYRVRKDGGTCDFSLPCDASEWTLAHEVNRAAQWIGSPDYPDTPWLMSRYAVENA